MRRFYPALIAAVAAALPLAHALAEGIRQEPLQIPAVIGGRTYQLEALVVRPDDNAPHPLALINHGSPRDADDRPGMSPNRLWLQAAAFARRGWTAVTFLRRGYGHSQGGWVENFGSCSNPDYTSAGRTAAADLAAVARYMLGQPYVTKDKWISVGASAGGFATIALTADAPPGLAAAIAFAPGRGSRNADEVCGEKQLIAAFAAYGKTSRTPLLWVSAPNDHFFGPRIVSNMTAAFSKGGGQLTFVAAPPFGDDGHQLFSSASGMAIWTPMADRFLADNKLTLRDRLIEVTISDLAVPSSLGDSGRAAFKSYLESGPNKAFAISGSHFGWASGRRTSDEAVKDALGVCQKHAPGPCAVANVNDKPAAK
jgi:pimeloyl-ACP methyl ester carboxylesterase